MFKEDMSDCTFAGLSVNKKNITMTFKKKTS